MHNIVSEMALSAQMRRPRVMLLTRVDEINAFALGLTPADWTIVVTQGALTHLTRLEGLCGKGCSETAELSAAISRGPAPKVLSAEAVTSDSKIENNSVPAKAGISGLLPNFA